MPYQLNPKIGTVEWAENPLASKITLTDYGRLQLKYNIALDHILQATVLFQMDADKVPGLAEGELWVQKFGRHGELEDIDKDITKWAVVLEKELVEIHNGDCTHKPMSCIKCCAEEMLDFYTTEGLVGAGGHHVQAAFRQPEVKTLDQAAHWLLTAPFKAEWEGWEQHVPRWTKERQTAAAWLQTYKAERLMYVP
jgi:hypothetical protein